MWKRSLFCVFYLFKPKKSILMCVPGAAAGVETNYKPPTQFGFDAEGDLFGTTHMFFRVPGHSQQI